MGAACSGDVCYSVPSVPCCGFKSVAFPLTSYPQANWMERLAKNNPNLLLRKTVMVSSHDAGTYSISHSTCCSGVSRTQEFSLYKQLCIGSRHLDLRYAPKVTGEEKGLVVQHGPHSGSDFYAALQEVLQWLDDHPKEFLILRLCYEAKSGRVIVPAEQVKLIGAIQRGFSKYAVTEQDLHTWFQIKEVTLAQASSSYKRVLIYMDPSILKSFDPKVTPLSYAELIPIGIHIDEDVIHSEWHNTSSKAELFEKNDEHHFPDDDDNESHLPQVQPVVQTPKPSILDRFHISQLLLTPQGSAKHIIKYLLGIESLRVDQSVRKLMKNRCLQRYVRELSGRTDTLNLVMMDFIETDPQLLQFLIGLNSRTKFKVVRALYREDPYLINNIPVPVSLPTDVTDAVRQLVVRDNSLWFLDWALDLKIPNIRPGVLTLDISLENGTELPSQIVKVHDFKDQTDYTYLFNWENVEGLNNPEIPVLRGRLVINNSSFAEQQPPNLGAPSRFSTQQDAVSLRWSQNKSQQPNPLYAGIAHPAIVRSSFEHQTDLKHNASIATRYEDSFHWPLRPQGSQRPQF